MLLSNSFTAQEVTHGFSAHAEQSENWGFAVGWQTLTGDINGDGRADLIYTYSDNRQRWRAYALANGSGFDPAVIQSETWGWATGWQTLTGDINGDGRTDLIYTYSDDRQRLRGYALSNGDGFEPAVNQAETWGWATGWQTFTGDVNGDGRTDLIYSYSDGRQRWRTYAMANGNGFDSAVNQLETWGWATGWKTLIGDVNGDGRSDLIYVYSDSSQRRRAYALSMGNGFGPISEQTEAWGWASAWQTFIGDVNGDGLSDLIYVYSDSSQRRRAYALSTGNGFGQIVEQTEFWGWASAWQTFIGDVNGDGLSDLIYVYSDNSQRRRAYALSTGNGFGPNAEQSESWGWATDWQTLVSDSNGDGRSDLLYTYSDTVQRYRGYSTAIANNFDMLVGLANGLGAQTTITYRPLTDSTVYTKGTGAAYPVVDVQAPMYVVSSTSSSNGINGSVSTSYTYAGARAHMLGRGMLGFRTTTVTDNQTGVKTTSTFFQDDACAIGVTVNLPGLTTANDYLCSGMVLSVDRRIGSVPLSYVSNTSPTLQTTYPKVYFAFVPQTSETAYVANDGVTASTQVYSTTTSTQYGQAPQYGDPTRITATTTETATGAIFTKQTDNTYSQNDAANWILGRLTQAQVTSTIPGVAPQTRTSSFHYRTDGLLDQEVIEPNDPTRRLQTDYGYNAFGSRTTLTVSGGVSGTNSFVATRTTTTTYDAQGRFPITVKNALNHQETRTFDARFGAIATLIGPNGVVNPATGVNTVWTYDGFGRKNSETRADGTVSNIFYELCSSLPVGTCPQYGAYRIRSTATGAPEGIVYFDNLNRETRSVTQIFDSTGNVTVYKDTVYDSLGRIQKVSRPYKAGTTPIWATTTYDILGRVTSITAPDGGVVSTSYSGLSVTVTPPVNGSGLRNVVTRTSNSQGQLLTVVDSSGTMSYAYDPFGNLIRTTDPAGNQTTMVYDIRGFKTSMTDPDMGTWTYEYSALGELKKQTDAKAQITTINYDVLGRMTQRAEPTFTSNWYYDKYANNTACNKGIGKLCEETNSITFRRTYTYDSLGRVSESATYLDSSTNPYRITTTYGTSTNDANCGNALGKVCTVTYPATYGTVARVAVRNVYNGLGYLAFVRDAANNANLWVNNGLNVDGNVVNEQLGNLLTTTRNFDPNTGRLTNINTGSGSVQNISFAYDLLGNLTSRIDSFTLPSTTTVNETFGYDALNRLTSVNMTGATTLSKSYQYNAIGNLTYKSDTGYLDYTGPRPHAVKKISATPGGTALATFTYDNNGNRTGGDGRPIAYNSFNLVYTATKGTTELSFLYDTDHNRIKETKDATHYTFFVNPGGALMFEKEVNGAVTHYKHYISSATGLIAIRTIRSDGTADDKYLHKDHLGSVVAVTSSGGGVLEHLSYDAFGKRRNANGSDAATAPASFTRRGFTQHEMLDEVDLIHMNGRVYDHKTGRFLSPDPFVQTASYSQDYNRYSYVQNNPLSITDPTGLFSFREFVHNSYRVAQNPFKIENHYRLLHSTPFHAQADRYIQNHTWARAVRGAAAAYFGGAIGAAFVAGYETWLDGGSRTDIYKASGVSIVTSMAFYGVGSATQAVGAAYGAQAEYIFNVVGHAAVGCASAAASGGECGSGAAGAGFGAAVGVLNTNNAYANFAIAVVAGGIGAELGGGKFANGALTAAMGHLFNCIAHECFAEGQDAERAFTDYLRENADPSLRLGYNRWYDSEDNFFWGRPDIFSERLRMVWDVKPDSRYGWGSGEAQIGLYTANGIYAPGTGEPLFQGRDRIALSGRLNRYEFRFGGNGLVVYQTLDASRWEQAISRGFRDQAARMLMPPPGRGRRDNFP